MTYGRYMKRDDAVLHFVNVVTIDHQQMALLHCYIMSSFEKNCIPLPHPPPFSASL